jgi:hypothetical protein
MTDLDVAGLVVIAGQVLGIGTDAALSQLDIAAAESALAGARLAGPQAASAAATSHRPGSRPPGDKARRHTAAGAAVALMHALLRHPPLPGHGEQVAVAAGLQFLAVNGWQADLDVPRAAAIAIQRLASGQLAPADATSWLETRLSPDPASPERETSVPALLPPGSRARRIMLAPVTAARHRRHRHSRPGPFLITLGSADKPAGIRTPATGFVPFTSPALNSVVRSGQEARRLGQARGTEHFLLGLASGSDGMAVKALERLGITPNAVRRQVELITGQGEPPAPAGRTPDNPEARRLWHAVLDEAVAHGDDYIGTGHILLALFSNSDAAAAQALARLGAGETDVRTVLAALPSESGPERSA